MLKKSTPMSMYTAAYCDLTAVHDHCWQICRSILIIRRRHKFLASTLNKAETALIALLINYSIVVYDYETHT